VCHGLHLRAAFVELQAQRAKALAHGFLPAPQRTLVGREQREVIDVAQIRATAEFVADEEIEGMQVDTARGDP